MGDTLNHLCSLYKKFHSNDFSKNTIVAPIKLVSKSDKSSNNIFALQLSAIPGLSYSTALIISKKYNTMSDLVNAFNESGELLLVDLFVTDKRKLGKAMSCKIFNSLFSK